MNSRSIAFSSDHTFFRVYYIQRRVHYSPSGGCSPITIKSYRRHSHNNGITTSREENYHTPSSPFSSPRHGLKLHSRFTPIVDSNKQLSRSYFTICIPHYARCRSHLPSFPHHAIDTLMMRMSRERRRSSKQRY